MPAPASRSPIVELSGAARCYAHGGLAVAALSEITLRFPPGQFAAIIGPSGCGKSTLLNLVSGVDRPDSGRVEVCGVDLGAAGERQLTELRRRSIGVVFQAFHLVANLSAEENVALPLALAGRRDPERVRTLLKRVGLGQRLAHRPGELSGGEQQRVAVARALVHRPRLVVADEPTGNLDSASGEAVLDLLDELRRVEGATLLLATHDSAIAARAERVIELHDGRVVGDR